MSCLREVFTVAVKYPKKLDHIFLVWLGMMQMSIDLDILLQTLS